MVVSYPLGESGAPVVVQIAGALSVPPLFIVCAGLILVAVAGVAVCLVWVVRSGEYRDPASRRQLFRTMIDVVPDAIHVKDAEGRFLILNRYLRENLGVREEDAVGKTVREAFGTRAAEGYWEDDLRVLQNGEEVIGREEPWEQANAPPRWFVTSKVPLRDPRTGKITGMVAISHDITERKRIEEALRTSEARFASAFRSSPDAFIVTLYTNGKIIEINDAFTRLTGWLPEEVLGTTTLERKLWAEPSDRHGFLRALEATGRVSDFEVRLCTKAGELRHTLISSELVDWEGQRHILSIVRDVTEQKRAKEILDNYRHDLEQLVEERTAQLAQANASLAKEVERTQAREQELRIFRQFAEYAAKGFIMSTTDHRVVYVNPMVEEWVSKTPKSPDQPRSLFDFYDPASREQLRGDILPALAQQGRWSGELVLKAKDGQYIPTLENYFVIRDDEGHASLIGDVITDLTAQKQIQAELAEANEKLREADRFKSEFLAMMSHELRTPLNSVIGFTGVLLQELAGPINDEQKRQLGLIDSSARHLLSLISDLLDLSSIESDHVVIGRQALALTSVLHEVEVQLEPAAQAKGLSLDIRRPAEDLLLNTDRRRVFQILLNLVDNAIKYTDTGGVTVWVEPAPEQIRVRVIDTGCGVAADQFPQLFEAFRRLDGSSRQPRQGFGLGLHLSRKLAHLLGGDLTATSKMGSGSTFTLTLPRSAP